MESTKSVRVITGLVLCCVIMLANANGANNTSAEKLSRRRRYVGASAGGAMFTRWGRTVCPDEGQFVYKGYVGSAHYTHQGSGSNYICLPHDPIFGNTIAGVQNYGLVYGTEYENIGHGSFSNKNAEKLHNQDAPCAVCRSSNGTSTLMIPARNKCYDGWHAEYKGFLVSQHYAFAGKTEYVCVDHDPEVVNGGGTDKNGALFYQVEAVCGALPCPPYAAGKELTCVVCTK